VGKEALGGSQGCGLPLLYGVCVCGLGLRDGQFGKDGKLTGSIQKSTGKVSMQVQLSSGGVVTSFNINGMMKRTQELVGMFSGCEISKTAANVAGSFRCSRATASIDSPAAGAGDAASESD
jgi:hypothetical protein